MEQNKEINLEKFAEIRRKMNLAETFIQTEAKAMGITLTREQACVFANAVLRAYGV